MKIDRLIGILTFLLQKEKTTALVLSERFEVSRRTIMRDLDALAQAGIPIYTKQGGDGGIAIMPGYKIDKSVLTPDELQSIMTGLKSLDSISKASNTERLIEKLSSDHHAMISLNEHIIIDLSSHYKDSLSEKIGSIKQSITDGLMIEFDYYYSKGEMRRRIEPYFIQFKWTTWYVYGFCTERQDFRLFKLNRLWNLKLTDEHFQPRIIPKEAAERNGVFSDPYHVKLLFDKSIRFRLIEEYGLHCYKETNEGLLLDLTYTSCDYIKSWILSFGEAVTVLEPDGLKEALKRTAENIGNKYK